ncbi:MAG: ABC transporter ATP-binding protein [Bacteroidales bacterium]
MILQYAKKYSTLIVGQLFFATIWVLSQLAIPRLMVDIIDYGIMVNDMNEIVNRGMLMLLATVVNIVSLLISIYFLTRVTAGISRDLRGDLFERIIDWSRETRGGFSNSTLITRTVNDVKQVSILIDMSLRKIYTLTITLIGAVIISFSIDAKMASIILIIIPVIFILALSLTSKALPKYSRIRNAIDRMNQRFRENVTGIRVVKAFNKSGYETKMFREATKEACQANVQAESTMMLLSPLVLLFTNILILILLYLGGVRAVLGTITVGALIGLIEYAIMALNNIQQFASIITIFPRSKVSIDRIQEILSIEEVLQIRETTEGLKENVLRFEDVDFYYPNSNAAVLHDIHFDLVKGETKAVIGSTGSGKSTLVRLMMRDYDAYRGQITCNGQDIEGLSNAEINHIITHIPQSTFLFSGTIRDNLQAGKKDATDEEIWEVLDMVQMGDFFRQAGKGLDFYIAQNAVNLSGGQKQRISIARGLIRETDFYVFDDCFSALDYSTEKKVRQAIQKKLSEKGVLVIAQRVATVKDADEILVIDNGKIVGKGSHQELEEKCQVYQEIISSQKRIDKGGAG